MTSSNGNLFLVTGLCAGKSPVTGEFPTQKPVTRSFEVFFDLLLINQLSKQWRRWWFETLSPSLWRHCNEIFPSIAVELGGMEARLRLGMLHQVFWPVGLMLSVPVAYGIHTRWMLEMTNTAIIVPFAIALWSVRIPPLIAWFMGPTWGPPGTDRTQVCLMLARWILLSGSVGFMLYIQFNGLFLLHNLTHWSLDAAVIQNVQFSS